MWHFYASVRFNILYNLNQVSIEEFIQKNSNKIWLKNIGSPTKGNRKERSRQQQQNGGEEGKLEALHLFLSWRKTDSCICF